ncbi:hypothetical protein SAMN05660199_04627 [Klenkia soli]|uniref:Uncharacterized protein n=1 Tax=Klenkia soli TaxID=1052260 RepID=A0A1H0UU97_9ACTN|nr:hypothetical protein [Klenkia soli]SDP69356.1 hypothetical protein SAMN05660199_04627 [Klenkia soli]
MDPVADRKRKRTILGYTEIPCPHCGGGPLVLTSSRYKKRLRDTLKPRFDAGIAYREVCQACRMRFSVSPGSRPPLTRSASMSAAPTPLFSGTEPAGIAVDSDDDDPLRPATPIRSTKPTQAAFFTDDDELDD